MVVRSKAASRNPDSAKSNALEHTALPHCMETNLSSLCLSWPICRKLSVTSVVHILKHVGFFLEEIFWTSDVVLTKDPR